MATKKRRRAPSADWLAMTPADRQAVRQSRANAQSSRYQRESAIEMSVARTNGAARQEESKK
jgi:hypothetical protein